MLTFINVMAWMLVLGIPLYGMRRGSSAVLCIGVHIFLFSVLVLAVAPSLAASVPLQHDATGHVNIGWWQLLLFIPLFGLAFPLGLFLNRFIAHTFEPFEEVLGMLFGLAVAFIAVRTFLGAIAMCATGSEFQVAVEQLFLVRQTVELDGFHNMKAWFVNLHNTSRL